MYVIEPSSLLGVDIHLLSMLNAGVFHTHKVIEIPYHSSGYCWDCLARGASLSTGVHRDTSRFRARRVGLEHGV